MRPLEARPLQEPASDPRLHDASGLLHALVSGSLRDAVADAAPPLPVVYRLGRLVGEGGAGQVFEAYDDRVGRTVALKRLRVGRWATDDERRRFEREQRLLASLQHPHIPRLLDAGVGDDGVPFFTMDFLEGQPVDAYCASAALPPPQRLRLFLDVCDALVHAHRRLIVHRDLKPSNVLVTASGQVNVLDFGIAHLVEGQGTGAFTVPMLTPRYASPAQLRGEPPSTSDDVFSLGVLLFALLAGVPPWAFPAAVPASVLEHLLAHPPRALRMPLALAEPADLSASERTYAAAPPAPDDLARVVAKALSVDAAQRYASVEAFAKDLERYLAGRPVEAQPDTWRYRAHRFVRRNRRAVAAAAAALVLFAALNVGYLLRLQDARRRAEDARDRALQSQRAALSFVDMLGNAKRGFDSLSYTAGLDSVLGRYFASDALDDAPDVRAELLDAAVLARLERGNSAEALPLAEEAVALRMEDPDSVAAAASLAFLANAQAMQGRFDLAIPNARRVLRLYETYGPEGFFGVAYATQNLARILAAAKHLSEARTVYERSIGHFDRLYGPFHPHSFEARALLGQHLVDVRPAVADTLLRFLLRHQDRVLAPDARARGHIFSLQIQLLRRQRGHAAVMEAGRAYLAFMERTFGRNDVQTRNVLRYMSVNSSVAGRYDEAWTYSLDALARDREAEGENALNTLHSATNLAVAAGKRRDTLDAAARFADVLARWTQREGEGGRNRLNALRMYGVFLRDAGHSDRALPLLDEAVRRYRALRETPAFDEGLFGQFLGDLCRAQYRLRRYPEAVASGREALAIAQRLQVYPDDVPSAQHTLALALAESGQRAEARRLLNAAHAAFVRLGQTDKVRHVEQSILRLR